MQNHILTIQSKSEEKFLRKKTRDFDFSNHSPKEIHELVVGMRKAMKLKHGIGLSANQIGLTYRVFVADVPQKDGENKFYTVFNPRIEKTGKEQTVLEEGCLSVPGTYGRVTRPSQIVLSGTDKKGKPLKIKAWGLLAKVFQHEIDHLNGVLFIDKAAQLTEVPNAELLQKREEAINSP